MTKKINTQKLETLGADKARAACVVHATAAIKAQERGDQQAFYKHCDLLDQCAAIGRKLLGNDKPPRTADQVITQLVS